MRFPRLLEALPLPAVLAVPFAKQSGVLEHTIHRARADSYDILIEHHESQATVAVKRMSLAVGDDRLLLPQLEPKITGIQLLCSFIMP